MPLFNAPLEEQVNNYDIGGALAGTSGVPSSSNQFVTNDDPRNSDAREPLEHASTHQPGSSDPLPTGSPVDISNANSSGSSTTFSKADHVHNLPFLAVQTVLGNATATLGINNQRLTNVATPINPADAVTKSYVDSLSVGLQWKSSVKVATTSSGTLATDFENGDTIDGVVISTGDRILVKDQTTASENGIYIVASSGAPTRAADMNIWSEVPNAAIFIEQGTANADRGYVCTSNSGGTLETSDITFIQFSSITTYMAGDGIDISSLVVSINHDGNGLTFNSNQLALELDGSTLSKTSSGLKISDGGISNTQISSSAVIDLTKLQTLTASRVIVSNASGYLTASTATSTEVSYLSGVTSAVQTQLNNKQPIDATLTSLSTFNTNGILTQIAPDTFSGRTIIGTTDQITLTNGSGVSGNPVISISSNPIIPGTGSTTLPVGTTAQRSSPANNGMIRFNSSNSTYEVVINSQWYPINVVTPTSAAVTVQLFDDLITSDSQDNDGATFHGSQFNWQTYMSGTGTIIQTETTGINTTDRCLGVIGVHTGTTSTGRCGISLGNSQILIGYVSLNTEWRVRHSTLATAGSQDYNTYIGFIDNMGSTSGPTDGVYFTYNIDSSSNWIISTTNNGTTTNTTTSVSVSSTVFQKLRIAINEAGTSAEFFIDDVSVGTITTNIPTASGRYTGLGIKMVKEAGTSNRILYIDYASLQYTYSAAR